MKLCNIIPASPTQIKKEYYVISRVMGAATEYYLKNLYGTAARDAIQIVLTYPDGEIVEFPIAWNQYSESELSPLVHLHGASLAMLDDDLVSLLKEFGNSVKTKENLSIEGWEQILKSHGFVEDDLLTQDGENSYETEKVEEDSVIAAIQLVEDSPEFFNQ